MMSRKLNRNCFVQILTGVIAVLLLVQPAISGRSKEWKNSPLTDEEIKQVRKASSYVKSGQGSKAAPLFAAAISSANDIPKCLAIAEVTESYGFPLNDVRRQCLAKAISLCANTDDYLTVITKARRYSLYEVTREAVNNLIAKSNSVDDLYALAHKAQEVALHDVAHMAMQKAYPMVRTVPEAINFAKESRVLGMDDLVRKSIKDLIDDENDPHQLMVLLRNIEPFEMPDLERYLFKKSLDKAMTVDSLHEIWEEARRHHQDDIYKIAAYRGRRLILIERIKNDQAEYQRQMQAWREGRQPDQQNQELKAAEQMDKQGGGKESGF
jgi:hypothetical protein